MNLKKVMATVALGAFSMSLLAGCGGQKQEQQAAPQEQESYKIGIVQLVTHSALDNANQGFQDALADNGYVEGENVTYNYQNAQGEQSNLQTIAQQFLSEDLDLIYAIATPAAQVMAAATEEVPIIGSAITDYVSAKLVESNEEPATNVTGTSDMNPITDQIDLLMQLVPGAKTIGVVYTSSEVNSQVQVEAVKAYCETLGVEVVEATISTVNDIQQAVSSIATKVDGIYLPTDNNIASAMPQVASITDEAKLVVVCGEQSMVEAGGTATYGIDYYKLGYQTGLMAINILNGIHPAELPIEFAQAEDLAVTINATAVERLGIEVPAELAERATMVTAE